MTEEEFRTGITATQHDKVEQFHQVGLSKLHAHFKAMQAKAAEYLEPDIYVPHVGTHVVYDHGAARNRLFADDMLYMLDGPEQREAEADIEKPFDYVAEACLTLSPQWHGDKVRKSYFVGAMNNAIYALEQLDQIKKTLFYGRVSNNSPETGPFGVQANLSDLPQRVFMNADSSSNLAPQDAEILIHAIVGIATEAGEMLEALRNAYDGNGLDLVNIEEEIGDCKWYMAIASKVCGFKWGNDERKNIAKLRARFPDKFTEYDANNRNLAAEREILEK